MAVGLLGLPVFLVLVTQLSHGRAQAVAYRDFRLSLAEQVAPLGGVVPIGKPVAYLKIPSLGLGEVVLEGTTSQVLADGPGHARDTVLPGQPGVSVVFGRRATYGGPFWKLPSIALGTRIDVLTAQGPQTFLVDRIRRDGDPAPPGVEAGTSRLTLATAGGKPFLPGRTVYVDATMQSPAKPGYQPTAVLASAERAMSGDTAAALPLALWSQALLIVAAAATWLRRSWGRWQTHLCVVPVLLLVLWNVYDNVARLLPNLA